MTFIGALFPVIAFVIRLVIYELRTIIRIFDNILAFKVVFIQYHVEHFAICKTFPFPYNKCASLLHLAFPKPVAPLSLLGSSQPV